MKKLLIMSVMCLVAVSAGAQIQFGMKAGASLLSADMRSISDGVSNIKSKNAGISFGIMARIQMPAAGIFIQPELMYNNAKYRITSESGAGSKVGYNNIDLPVLVGLKFLFLDVYAGPVFNLKTFEKSDRVDICRPNVGYQAGLGLSLFSVIQIDARYQGYFSGKANKFTINGNTDHVKVSDGLWLITIGHFF